MAWDIIFFSLAGPGGDYTGAHTVIFRLQGCDRWGEGRGILYIKSLGGFFSIYYLPEDQRSCDVRGGGRGTLFFIASVVERLKYTYCRIQECMPHRRNWFPPTRSSESECVSPLGSKGGSNTLLQVRGWGTQFGRLDRRPGTLYTLWPR
jgi:hypothetical protein